MNKRNFREKGFTLIELLIVIVIIGILSGVLIAVINPVRQQNRSRNATIKAALNKAAFGISTARAGLGRLPYNRNLTEELENLTLLTTPATACPVGATDNTLACQFNIAGTVLPATCAANGFSGISTVACNLNVVAPDVQGNQFRIVAKKFRLNPGATEAVEPSAIYVFDSSKGFYECPAATAAENFTTVPDISAVTGCLAAVES